MNDYRLVDGIGIDFTRNRISVRTTHGVNTAKKMARLRLLEERVMVKELITISISRTSNSESDAERSFLFEW